MSRNEIIHEKEQVYHFSLIEKIIQRVVSLFYEKEYLLLLYFLQKSRTFMTVESLNASTKMKQVQIDSCLQSLCLDRILDQIPNPNKSGKYNKFFYVINYETAIESIIYRYEKLKNEHHNQNVKEVVYYKCERHTTLFPYEEAMKYYDPYEGKFYCPECDREMKSFVDSSTEGQNMIGLLQQLSSLKNELEQMKKTYSDVKDYPTITRPEHTVNGKNVTKQTKSREAINGKPLRILSFEPMPWEEDDIKEEVVKEVETKVIVKEIDYMSYDFLQPNKTFEDKREIISGSTQSSPIRAEPIIFTKKSSIKRKVHPRQISATPTLI